MIFGLGGVVVIVVVMRFLFSAIADMTTKPMNKGSRRPRYWD